MHAGNDVVPFTNGLHDFSQNTNVPMRQVTLTTRPICIAPETDNHDDGVHIIAGERLGRSSSTPSALLNNSAVRVKQEPEEDDDVIVTGEALVVPQASNMSLPPVNSSPQPLATVRLAANGGLSQANMVNIPPVAALRELIGSDGRRAEVVVQSRPQAIVSRPTGVRTVLRHSAPTGKAVRVASPQWNPPRIAPNTGAVPRIAGKVAVIAMPSNQLAVSTSAPPGGRKNKSLASPRLVGNVHSNGTLSDNSSPPVTSVRAFIEGIGLFPVYKPLKQDVQAVCSDRLKEYKCNACGDTFLFESSLQDHLGRKSCLLEYDCTVCGRVVAFHNRCLLLLHFADDALRTGQPPSLLNYDRVALKPLPADEDCGGENLAACVFCQLSMPQSSVASHFSGRHATSRWSCDKCGRLLASRCAAAAHASIHHHKSPLVCPECGDEYSEDARDAFQHHVRFTCPHHALQTLLKCPTCKQLKSVATFVSHLVEHMTIYYKCSACPMAFHSQTLLREHKDVQHKDSASSGRQIVKCQICAAILQHAAQLDLVKHMHGHAISAWQELIVAAYVCSSCPELTHFVDSAALNRHIRQSHASDDTNGEMCDLCGQVFGRAVKLTQHKEHCKGFVLPSAEQSVSSSKHKAPAGTVSQTGINKPTNGNSSVDLTSNDEDSSLRDDESLRCAKCQVMCQDAVMLAKHMRRHEVIASKKATFAARRPPTFSGRQVPNSSFALDYLCNTCDIRFADQALLDSHRREVHGEAVVYPCLLCGLIYDSDLQRTEHTKLVHETIGGQARYACPLCAQSGKPVFKGNQAALSRHITQGHKIKKDRAKELASKSRGDSEQTREDESSPPAKRLKTGDSALFTCAKCGHSTESRGLFMLHITTHRRPQEDGVQCFECGLLFTVLPAVKRHLHLVHGILDFDAYTRETGFNLEDGRVVTAVTERKVVDQRSSGSTEDSGGQRECSVCGKVFDGETLLRQHMRTHGMAFLLKRTPTHDTS